MLLLLFLSTLFAQKPIPIGGGSIADSVPNAVAGDDFYGTSYNSLKAKFNGDLHIDPALKGKRPIPTDDWWVWFMFHGEENGGHGGSGWNYPSAIQANANGISVRYVNRWGHGQTDSDMYTVDLQVAATGVNNPPDQVVDWSDLGFVYRRGTAAQHFDVTCVHGSPFTYIEFVGCQPELKGANPADAINPDGTKNNLGATTFFILKSQDRYFGVHLPPGSNVNPQNLQITLGEGNYLVISVIPIGDISLGATFDKYARNKIVNTKFTYKYDAKAGTITTTFHVDTKEGGTGAPGPTVFTFLPHHWRKTTTNFEYLEGGNFVIHHGPMKSAVGGPDFVLTYKWTGLPPYLPLPQLTPERKDHITQVLTALAAKSNDEEGNTYAKGFGEKTNVMLFAKELGLPEWEVVAKNMHNQLANWFTYDPAETNGKYFATYPEYGAVIGFPCGYGSQGFNDLHFHNGYFVTGAARLMMVDADFKNNFGEITKKVARTYANWGRYEEGDPEFQPWLRNFDPYCGHSWAGGVGDNNGDNQESTSEAIQSWFGLFLLGVVLEDDQITQLGATGFMLETEAASEYWLDLYGGNFHEEYTWGYVGILTSQQLLAQTYFNGDPAWVIGIQAVPCDFFYQHFGNNGNLMAEHYQGMLTDRIAHGEYDQDEVHKSVLQMEAYLGGYHLNIIQQFNASLAREIADEMWAAGGEFRTHVNMGHEYYLTEALVTYGRPAPDYHTSIASGAVYKNEAGVIHYLLYNPSANIVQVQIFKGNDVIDTINVGPGEFFREVGK